MTGESQGRPTQRMSRFSQAYRTMPPNSAAVHATLDERAERALHRADAMSEATHAGWPSPTAEPYADVIEVEFETVQPLPPAAEVREEIRFAPEAEPAIQPTPPDIEAIAAALAAEMDRNAARQQQTGHHDAEAHGVNGHDADAYGADAYDAGGHNANGQIANGHAANGFRDALAPQFTTPIGVPHVEAGHAPHRAESPHASAQRKLADRITVAALESARFARAKAMPALMQAGLWAAHNLRRKEIRRRYGKGLALLHGKLLDRRLEQHFYVPSLAVQRFGPDLDRGIVYEGPVPAMPFAWAMALLPENLREFAFVDFHAGRGRAMLLASQRNFERIVGYEYDAATHDDLQMNIAQFPRSRMVCRDVQCYRGDRTGVSIPDQPCVLYFSSAWRQDMLPGIMTYVRESYRHKPRRLYIVLENVDDSVVLPPDEVFHRLELPMAEKLKLRLFSPMDFQVYRSQV